MDDLDIEAIEARSNAATPGPWFWKGNTDIKDVTLSSRTRGLPIVMDFWRWGTQGAQPAFGVDGVLTRLSDPGMVRYLVCPEATSRADHRVYRADFNAINHPDAEFIAAAREDVPRLIARIRELEAQLAAQAVLPLGA